MRHWAVICLLGLVAGCSGIEGVDPPQMGANEMQPRPGVFSGPTGDFVLVGPKAWPENPEVVAEVGAGT
jgi:hypothetical protein